MGRAEDDRLVDSFDPGVETGYLRRARRDRELEPDLGAHPFDPGPGRYDDRRARKESKRRRREERRRQLQQRTSARLEPRAASAGAAPDPTQAPLADVVPITHRRQPTKAAPAARVQPRVQGPARRRHGLIWPTAKAGVAITLVLGLSAALGSLLGLPVPGLRAGTGQVNLANSADIFGIDPGTPTGLSSGFLFPVMGPHDFGTAADRFGATRGSGIHEGQDILAKPGTPEVAVHDGVVVDWGTENGRWSGGRGNYIAIYTPQDDRSFVYMHLLKPSPVRMGQQVHAGEVVGQVGCTGECDGPHLHFEIRIGKATLRSDTKPVDPLPYLRQWPQPTPG